jgi:glutaredoxin-like protein
MSLLNENIERQIRQAFEALINPVKIIMFTQGDDVPGCETCADTRQLLAEVSALSDKITLEVHDFAREMQLAEQYRIDKIPAAAILSGGDAPDGAPSSDPKDYGIRLYGVPAGYEFSTLIEDILMVSRQKPVLSAKTLDELKKLTQPVNIQVFVTPTCPYCPRAVVLAHQLAMVSDLITASMVEANEFPHLSNKYQVYGVPRTVIEDVIHVEGAIPEAMLVEELMKVLDPAVIQELRREWEVSLN